MSTSKPPIERRLAAILAADIAGYSALMGEDEETTVSDLKGHQSVILPMISEFGGRVIDTAGDGILAEYPSALNAVRCAVEIQQTMAERNVGVPPARQMRFRIGVNLGDIVFDESRIYGDGVNIAARLEALAPPGGICVSRAVREAVGNKLSVNFADLGEKQVKNIASPVHTFEIRMHGGQPSMHAEMGPAAPERSRWPVRAVIAFTVAVALAGIGLAASHFMLSQRPTLPKLAEATRPEPAPAEASWPQQQRAEPERTAAAPEIAKSEPAPAEAPRPQQQRSEPERTAAAPEAARSEPTPAEAPRPQQQRAEPERTAVAPEIAKSEPTPAEAPRPQQQRAEPERTAVAPEAAKSEPTPAEAPRPQQQRPEPDVARAEIIPPAARPLPPPEAKLQAASQAPQSGFDGEWIAILTGGAHCPLKSGIHRLIIDQEKVRDTELKTIGRVEKTGAIHYVRPSRVNPANLIDFNGNLSGNEGSGKYKSRRSKCVGVIEYRRSFDEASTNPVTAQRMANPPNRSVVITRSYDGEWKVSLTGGPQCAVRTYVWHLQIDVGKIDPSHPEPGHVEPDGKFQFTLPSRYGQFPILYSGQLNGDSGRGNYKGVGKCVGTIELARVPKP